MIQSKHKLTVMQIGGIALVIICCLLLSLIINFNSAFTSPVGGTWVVFLLVFIIWMILYNIKVQNQKIALKTDCIFVTNWGGFGKENNMQLHSSAASIHQR